MLAYIPYMDPMGIYNWGYKPLTNCCSSSNLFKGVDIYVCTGHFLLVLHSFLNVDSWSTTDFWMILPATHPATHPATPPATRRVKRSIPGDVHLQCCLVQPAGIFSGATSWPKASSTLFKWLRKRISWTISGLTYWVLTGKGLQLYE